MRITDEDRQRSIEASALLVDLWLDGPPSYLDDLETLMSKIVETEGVSEHVAALVIQSLAIAFAKIKCRVE